MYIDTFASPPSLSRIYSRRAYARSRLGVWGLVRSHLYLCVYNTQLITHRLSYLCLCMHAHDMHEHLAGAHSIVGAHGH